MKSLTLFIILLVLFFLSTILSLFLGSASIFDPQVFWVLRLPRVFCAVAVGGGLAVAGTLSQALLSNPLADPFLIGIASAAAFGAVIGSVCFHLPVYMQSLFAFFCALIGLLLLVFWLKERFLFAIELLLVGVVFGFFLNALTTIALIFAQPDSWTMHLHWLFGSVSRLEYQQSSIVLLLILFFCSWSLLYSKSLDLLTLNEMSAESLGVDVKRVRKRIYILTSIITALCVSSAGLIGFIGLIVPHFLRFLGVRSHVFLIPYSFITGAIILVLSDLFARTMLPPLEFPVGIFMIVLGIPFFLFFMRRQNAFNS